MTINSEDFADTPVSRKAPAYVTYSAWAVPLLVIGQFALLAAAPVALIVFGAFKDSRVRALRWWAAALGVVYASPLVIWLSRDDGAESLSKDIHPIFVALIAATSLVIAVKIYRSHRR